MVELDGGNIDGTAEGAFVLGDTVGVGDGLEVGLRVGTTLGFWVGAKLLGAAVGGVVGCRVDPSQQVAAHVRWTYATSSQTC